MSVSAEPGGSETDTRRETDAGTETDTWDVVVLGGGPPGEVAAQVAIAGSDRTAVIVEAERVGGECSYWACMPSKALLRPVEVLSAARALPGVVAEERLDVDAVLRRRDAFTHALDDAPQVAWARSAGIDVVRGRGRLVGERTVEVSAASGPRRLRARHAVVLATGTTATVPPVPGLRESLPWTSRDATNLHEVPDRVAVIGGGVVACEAAVWLCALGSRVTLLVRGGRLLERTEPFAGELVRRRFDELGIDVRTGVDVQRVHRPDVVPAPVGHVRGGPVTVTLDDAPLVVDEVLVAMGRTPATADLGLELVGLAEDDVPRGYLPTDDHLGVRGVRGVGGVAGVGGEWLYAVGDITGRALLTHQGKYQARIAGAVIAARAEGRAIDGDGFRALADSSSGPLGVPPAVPQVVFTDPQVAAVGLTEAQARAAGVDVETVDVDLASVAGASLLRDDYRGRARLVVDRAADVVVGGTFVGPEVAELIHAVTIAVVGRVPVSTLWHAVPAYPTVGEAWLRLLEALRDKRSGVR